MPWSHALLTHYRPHTPHILDLTPGRPTRPPRPSPCCCSMQSKPATACCCCCCCYCCCWLPSPSRMAALRPGLGASSLLARGRRVTGDTECMASLRVQKGCKAQACASWSWARGRGGAERQRDGMAHTEAAEHICACAREHVCVRECSCSWDKQLNTHVRVRVSTCVFENARANSWTHVRVRVSTCVFENARAHGICRGCLAGSKRRKWHGPPQE